MSPVWRLKYFDELPSTSDFCIERAKAGEAEGFAVFAASQSAGRGSRGRNWQTLVGNVALSVLLRPEMAAAQTSVFPLLAGVAVAEAVRAELGAAPVLKWPNDVLLGGAKCAGLLIDAAPVRDRVDWLVIGIGVNVGYAPEVPGRATTCLAAHGGAKAAPEFAGKILERLAVWLDVLAGEGTATVIAAWLGFAHPVGTELTVRTSQSETHGRFAGLGPAGELLLAVENRIETFSTGEILMAG